MQQKKRRKKEGNFRIPLKNNSLLDDPNENSDDSDELSGLVKAKKFKLMALDQSDISNSFAIDDEDTHISEDVGTNYTTLLINDQRRLEKKHTYVKVRRNKCNKLVPITVLPDKFQKIFDFKEFNKMQSEAFHTVYETDSNCVISSPTGSGKTVLFELAILNIMERYQMKLDNTKIIYLAPTRSLCSQILSKWSPNFLNLSVGMLTGDASFSETEKAKKCNVIITTPEKWDLITRKWNDYNKLFSLVRLILVDEIHILGEKRGATLEVVLTRMNYMCQNIRIVAASATIPNIDDIAVWLKSERGNTCSNAKILMFDESYRQVDLKTLVHGYNFYCKNDFQKDALYNSRLIELIEDYSKNKPVLIFCPTRASTISTAKYLTANFYLDTAYNKIQFQDRNLMDCVKRGISFHHAGLCFEDRKKVESEFTEGRIQILCSTSTLAVGVNLPAYLVIIKGTNIWELSEMKSYSNLEILQMMGRAGRPQFEKEGCAVIMTEEENEVRYKRLLNGSDLLESKLHLELIEHLCAEISLGTIKTTDDALEWLHNTFFYVRFQKNPRAYNELNKYVPYSTDCEVFLRRFCSIVSNKLENANLVRTIEQKFTCTPYGHALVRHYVTFDTIKQIIDAKENPSLRNVLELLVQAAEFKDVRMRHNEKRLYKEINMSPLIRFPFLSEKKKSQIIDQTFQKVSLLIQYELGGLEFPSYEWARKLHGVVVQDKLRCFRHCHRLLRCMIDCFIEKKDGNGLQHALYLLRSINGNSWDDSAIVLRQLKSVGLVSVRKLINHEITTWDDMRNLSPQQIEYYISLKTGLGRKIKNDIDLIPMINIQAKINNCKTNDCGKIEVVIKVELSSNFKSTVWHGRHLSVDVLSLDQTGSFIDYRRIQLYQLASPKSFRVNAVFSRDYDAVNVSAYCQEIAGIGSSIEITTSDLNAEYRLLLNHAPSTNSRLFEKNSNRQIIDRNVNLSSSPLSSDESLVQYLDQQKDWKSKESTHKGGNGNKNKILSCASITRRILENGNYKCNHSCKDKMHCRHICCREGIPRDALKIRNAKQKVIDPKLSDKKNENLIDKSFSIIATHTNEQSISDILLSDDEAMSFRNAYVDQTKKTVPTNLQTEQAINNVLQKSGIEEILISSDSDEVTDSQRLQNSHRPANSIMNQNQNYEATFITDDSIENSYASGLEFLGSDVDLA